MIEYRDYDFKNYDLEPQNMNSGKEAFDYYKANHSVLDIVTISIII